MIEKEYVCAKCEFKQKFEIFEANDDIPQNVNVVKPSCKRCGSEALIDTRDMNSA